MRHAANFEKGLAAMKGRSGDLGADVSSDRNALPAKLLSDDWLAESVRVSFFFNPETRPMLSMGAAINLIPEQVVERPAQGFKQEVAEHRNGLIVLTQVSGRIDLVFMAKPAAFTNFEALIHVGGFQSAVQQAYTLGLALCRALGAVNRMAFAPIAVKQTGSDLEAMRLISSYVPRLPVNLDMDRDLFWQINQKRRARTFNGFINNVSKWQSLNTQIIPVFFPAMVAAPSPGAFNASFVRLELDVNTSGEVSAAYDFGEGTETAYEEVHASTLTLLEKVTL